MGKLITVVRSYWWIVVLLALGVAMIIAPDAFEGYHAQGRRRLFKMIIQYAWGIPAGVILILVSVGIGVYAFKNPDTGDDDEEDE